MSSDTNKASVRRFIEEGINRRNFAIVEEVVGVDMVDHSAPPGLAPGREGMKQLLGMFLAAFPDFGCRIEDLAAEGDQVAARVTWSGTHQGPFMGLAPTGRKVSFAGITFYRLDGGKIVEMWDNSDNLGLMQQLTQVPDATAAA